MLRRIIAAALVALALLAPALAASVNVGVYTLAATGITAPLSVQVQSPVAVDLDGMTAASIEVSFAYGSGGSSLSATVQTTLDGGTTWRDVVRCDFTTSSRVCISNLSGLTAKAPASYSALASEGVNDGLLGDQLRAVLTSVGTYATTTVSVRASVR